MLIYHMRPFLLYLMAVLYIAAGINHFINPAMYRRIMPPWLPAHQALVILSGIAEILLGAMLLFRTTQVVAAWGLIILLFAVFPANIQMWLNYRASGHPYTWVALLRLPLQVLLIWWAYTYTKAPIR